MRTLLLLFCLALGVESVCADMGSAQQEGIIILKPVAGYAGGAYSFVTIEWVNPNGGFVADAAGNKTLFLNDGICRILYFDQAFYEGVDHNQYSINWRAGVQRHEIILPPFDTVSLGPDDLSRMQSEQNVLQDTVKRYPASGDLLSPMIATLLQNIANLTGGLVLQNGKWIAAKDAGAAVHSPVVGEQLNVVTFTTKDGRKFEKAKVTATDEGVSVVTAGGGASVAYDNLPDDLTAFPAVIRQRALEAKAHAAQAASTNAAPTPTGFWDTFKSYAGSVGNVVSIYGGKALNYSSAAVSSGSSKLLSGSWGDSSNSAMVTIKGDRAQGSGFLAKSADGSVIFTSLQVLAENPNVKFTTSTGQPITPLSIRAASDRSVAMISIKDNNYSYLELAPDVESVAETGDATAVYSAGSGEETSSGSTGKVVTIKPKRIDVDNSFSPINCGAPIYDTSRGKVIGVVVSESQAIPLTDFDKDGYASGNSFRGGSLRYYGLRLDNVPAWENYVVSQFIGETLFLRAFHDQSRAIESLISTIGFVHKPFVSDEGLPPTAIAYQSYPKVNQVAETYHTDLKDHDLNTAQRQLSWALGALADEDLSKVQNGYNFYAYNRAAAKRENIYRQSLKDAIDILKNQSGNTGATIPTKL